MVSISCFQMQCALHNDPCLAVHSEYIIRHIQTSCRLALVQIGGWEAWRRSVADWQAMQKSDIRYARVTADPRPAEGQIAAENIKCQECGNVQRESMWPTWHSHTRGCHCPKKPLYFHEASWLARLTSELWLFSLTARRGLLASRNGEVDGVMRLNAGHLLSANKKDSAQVRLGFSPQIKVFVSAGFSPRCKFEFASCSSRALGGCRSNVPLQLILYFMRLFNKTHKAPSVLTPP